MPAPIVMSMKESLMGHARGFVAITECVYFEGTALALCHTTLPFSCTRNALSSSECSFNMKLTASLPAATSRATSTSSKKKEIEDAAIEIKVV